MSLDRRRFIVAAAGALAGTAGVLAARSQDGSTLGTTKKERTDEPAAAAGQTGSILVLGGTGFLGPQVVEAARRRGFTVTLFNRGKTRPTLFPDIEKLHGDRDPKKGEGLKALEGRSWDAVVDTSGYYPRLVKASAEMLADHVKQYVFISTLSVYKSNDTPGMDESAEVGTIPDPTVETMGNGYENYGPLKALCEQAAETALPGRATIIRPGFIVGPEDFSGRFNYWPLRVREGGRMIAPGSPEVPIQLIDVRDLGDWIVHTIERRIVGTFNATGPKDPLTTKAMLEACVAASGVTPEFVWVPVSFLEAQGVGIGAEMPIWLPSEGETAGFHQRSVRKAIANGLTFRPLKDTCAAILAWYDGLDAEKQKRFRAGWSSEREAEVLKAWEEKK